MKESHICVLGKVWGGGQHMSKNKKGMRKGARNISEYPRIRDVEYKDLNALKGYAL